MGMARYSSRLKSFSPNGPRGTQAIWRNPFVVPGAWQNQRQATFCVPGTRPKKNAGLTSPTAPGSLYSGGGGDQWNVNLTVCTTFSWTIEVFVGECESTFDFQRKVSEKYVTQRSHLFSMHKAIKNPCIWVLSSIDHTVFPTISQLPVLIKACWIGKQSSCHSWHGFCIRKHRRFAV